MTAGDVFLIYILGIVLGAVIAGRFKAEDALPFLFLWPVILPIAVVIGTVGGLYHLGTPPKKKKEIGQ